MAVVVQGGGPSDHWLGDCWHREDGADEMLSGEDDRGVGGTLEHHNVAAKVQQSPTGTLLFQEVSSAPPPNVQKVHFVLHVLRLKNDPVCRR